ncbi:MAG: nucleotidyl transferase AbiEii/AbiGii toxin family protein [Weeksellaceae bacterium]
MLLPVIALFKKEYYLVGETAIALHLGHRQSVDFDLFKKNKLRKNDIFTKLRSVSREIINGYEDSDQLNLMVDGVKFTFFQFPYEIPIHSELEGIIKMPNLLTLSAMKAFALVRRAKWKDYVDLYFILKFHFSIKEISNEAKVLFKDQFSEKMFKMQLGYFDGINYDEEVNFLFDNPSNEQEVKNFLTEISLSEL